MTDNFQQGKQEALAAKLGKWAGYLAFVPMALTALMGWVIYSKPYVLEQVGQWLNRSTTEYFLNPAILWLFTGEFLIGLGWMLLAKPKPFWQWIWVVLPLIVSTVMLIMLMRQPVPIFNG